MASHDIERPGRRNDSIPRRIIPVALPLPDRVAVATVDEMVTDLLTNR
jgi:hypothetical protein